MQLKSAANAARSSSNNRGSAANAAPHIAPTGIAKETIAVMIHCRISIPSVRHISPTAYSAHPLQVLPQQLLAEH